VLYRLETEGFGCVLADARQVKNLPGRPKRDTTDSQWLAACFERGSVFPCFVATPEFRIIRLRTRRRRDLTDERTRQKQRAEKLLEDAAIKLSSVLTGLHGVTGRDIMDRLIAGERDPRALAECARTRARGKIPELRAALEGAEFFTTHHAALLKSILNRIDSITTEIGELSLVIGELPGPYEEQLQQAESMPGWGRRAAQDVITETGVDMSRFPTPGHLASWCGRTPLDKQSGARKGQRRHKRGNKYITAVLGRDCRRRRENPDPRGRPAPQDLSQARQSQSRRCRRQHPDEGLPRPAARPRRPAQGPRPRLLRTPARPQPPRQPPRWRARQPRLRGHPLLQTPAGGRSHSLTAPRRLTLSRRFRRRLLPRARLRSIFRLRLREVLRAKDLDCLPEPHDVDRVVGHTYSPPRGSAASPRWRREWLPCGPDPMLE
jgi:transposase